MWTVTSKLAHHTQYIEAQLLNICVCVYVCTYKYMHKICTNQGSHIMISTTESRIWRLMCHNSTLTIWMTVSSLLSWWSASICQTRAPKPWWWMRGRQSDRYDWLTSHLQQGCSNVDMAWAVVVVVVVVITVGQWSWRPSCLLPPTRLIQMISRQEGSQEQDWQTMQQK